MPDRAEHEGRQHDARRGRRGADHSLNEQRHERDRPEHRHPDERHAGNPSSDRRAPQEVEGEDRLAHAPLDQTERARAAARGRERPDHLRASSTAYWRPPHTSPSRSAAVPPASSAAPSQSIECSRLLAPLRHRNRITTSASAADRQVDVEDPAPARVVDDEARRPPARRSRRRRRWRRSAPGSGRGRAAGRSRRPSRARAEKPAGAESLDGRGRATSSVMLWASPQSAEPTQEDRRSRR